MNVRTIPAEVLIPAQALAAENPVWDADRGGLWWIDVRAPRLHFWSTNAPARQWDMPSPIGFVALGDEGQVVVGLVDGVCILDCNTGNLDHLFILSPNWRTRALTRAALILMAGCGSVSCRTRD